MFFLLLPFSIQVVMENTHVVQPMLALDALANNLGLGMGLKVLRNKGLLGCEWSARQRDGNP
jgi:hypothetical protein